MIILHELMDIGVLTLCDHRVLLSIVDNSNTRYSSSATFRPNRNNRLRAYSLYATICAMDRNIRVLPMHPDYPDLQRVIWTVESTH